MSRNFSIIRQNLTYKMGNSTFHVQVRFVSFVALVGLMCLIIFYLALPPYSIGGSNLTNSILNHEDHNSHSRISQNLIFSSYNNTYPITPPIYTAKGFVKYRIAIISDLDTESKHPHKEHTWLSYLKKGYLTVNIATNEVSSLDWDKDTIALTSQLSYGGRGMELSELVTFNGKLYSFDDRTGIVYELDMTKNTALPWVILNDGDGKQAKGFKSEWATVKGDLLYVGSLGKEWTTASGELINHNPQYVKTIDANGVVRHYDWTQNYEALRKAENIEFPGYMIHESCVWSTTSHNWIFLPRRASHESYSEKEDEHRGTNLMIKASENFRNIEVKRVGELVNTHGFSSFKFVPGTNDSLIVALKSKEVDGKASSYIMVFDTTGKVLFPEQKVADFKFEGIEFI